MVTLLAVVALLALTGCGGENDVSPPPAPTAAPKVIEATATPVAPMATAVVPTVVPTFFRFVVYDLFPNFQTFLNLFQLF